MTSLIRFLFITLLFCFTFLGKNGFAEEKDSFWDEEFFQEESLTRLQQAEEALKQEKWADAIAAFQVIVESPLDKSEYEEALLGLATAYDRQGKINEAISLYRTLSRKAEDKTKVEQANQRIHYYQNYILGQFHIGGWYPKLWFHEITSQLAQKHPRYAWLFQHGSYPILLLLYKFLLILLFLFFVFFISKKGEKVSPLFEINWGFQSVFLIYSLFLLIQLYLVFLLKPTPNPSDAVIVAFDVISILSYLILIAAVLLFLTFRGIPWRRLGIGWQHLGNQLLLTLKYMTVLAILFGVFAFLRAHGFIEQGKVIHAYPLSSIGGALYFFQFFLLVVVAPVSEEIFYRGFIYPVVRNRIGILKGILLTSLFFALVHVQSLVLLFFLSFFLCFTYEKNRSLIPPILVHAFYNFLVRFGGSFLPGNTP